MRATTAAMVLALTIVFAVTDGAKQSLCGPKLENHFETICKPHVGPFKKEVVSIRELIDGESVFKEF